MSGTRPGGNGKRGPLNLKDRAMELKKIRIVACPVCKKMVPYENNPYRPFCSRGCKGVDLIHWSDESYKIAKEEHDDDSGAEHHGQ
jgi:hypothetical protein